MNHPEDQKVLSAFGKQIRRMRIDTKLSQENLADKAGVHRTYIGMIERGEKNITLITMHRISIALGVSVIDMIKGAFDGQ